MKNTIIELINTMVNSFSTKEFLPMEKDGLYLGGISFNVSKAETLSFGTFAILISEESAPYNPETSTFKVAIQSLPTVFETELYGIADIPAKYRSFVVKYAKEAF